MGVLGSRCGSRRGRDEVKFWSEAMAGKGVKRSEEMVTGRAKRVGFDVKAAKALWRSSEAIEGEWRVSPEL